MAPNEDGAIEVTESTILRKYEGSPETGMLVQTVEIQDGQIVSVTNHAPDHVTPS